MHLSRLCLVLSGLVVLAEAHAEVRLASLFTDHAVLQREKPVPVWGLADPGEHVTVTFRTQSFGTTADATGRWGVMLEAMDASGKGADLVAAGKTTTAAVHDLVVGEVWLCSGQSNMEFVVKGPDSTSWRMYQALNAAEEVAAAQYPLIRQFKVEHQIAATPVTTAKGAWELCSPQTADHFTAAGYFFARQLFHKLNVPIGLVNCSFGGTPVQAWLSEAAYASDPACAAALQRWKAEMVEYPAKQAAFQQWEADWVKAAAAAKAKGTVAEAKFLKEHPNHRGPFGPMSQFEPKGLFNGMVSPLIPYALRGFLWYQGESNADHPQDYAALFAALITTWRAHFGQGDLPFYFVQLANFKAPGNAPASWAYIREAQAAALALPETGMAVAIDIGEPDNIHPRNKQEVGRRLALIAQAKLYNLSGDVSGPLFAGIEPAGTALRVRFTYAETGLITHDKPVQSLELAGADRRFYPASARIDGETLLVSSPSVPQPVAVRYAWANSPVANLFNGAGLPAAPFRSDRW